MRNYEKPELKVMELNVVDVIQTSPAGGTITVEDHVDFNEGGFFVD